MARYHINPETGRPNQCTAKVRCRFGADTQHFDSKEDARAGYEKQMQSQTVSGSLKKNSATAASKVAVFDSKAVEEANEKIQEISNGAVMIGLADYALSDSSTLIVAFDAEHDMCIVIEDHEGKRLAYSAYGPDPRRTRYPLSEYVTATRIDDLAMENDRYRPGGWDMEPSRQGAAIAKIINDLAAEKPAVTVVPKATPATPKAAPKAAPAKTVTAAPTVPKPLAVIPGVPPVMTAQELDYEQGELDDELHGYTVKRLLRDRDITAKEVQEAERRGDFYIGTKVPSYSEVTISTDLARRELGLPARSKTGIDESPLRVAEIAKDEAYSKTFGIFHSREEHRAAQQKYQTAREEFLRLREEHQNSKG